MFHKFSICKCTIYVERKYLHSFWTLYEGNLSYKKLSRIFKLWMESCTELGRSLDDKVTLISMLFANEMTNCI